MEALELEIRRGFDVEWSLLHRIRNRGFFKLCQGIELGCEAIITGELTHSRSGCTRLQEGVALLVKDTWWGNRNKDEKAGTWKWSQIVIKKKAEFMFLYIGEIMVYCWVCQTYNMSVQILNQPASVARKKELKKVFDKLKVEFYQWNYSLSIHISSGHMVWCSGTVVEGEKALFSFNNFANIYVHCLLVPLTKLRVRGLYLLWVLFIYIGKLGRKEYLIQLRPTPIHGQP